MKGNKCYFGKKPRHFQKDCPKCKAWFEKKGKLNAFVYFKLNLTKVPHNTWWIDSRCTTHVYDMMQGFLIIQTISLNDKFVFMEKIVKALVESVRTYHLILDIGHHLDLLEAFYISSISRNLVFVI